VLALLVGIISGFAYTFLSISSMVVIMRYTLSKDSATGIMGGLGVVVVQFIWAAIAASILGLAHWHLISGQHIDSLKGYDSAFVLLGVMIIGFMGYRILRNPTLKNMDDKNLKADAFVSTFLLSLSRPIRILGYLALFSLLGGHRISGISNGVFIVLGTGIGSFIWWSVFVSVLAKHREKATEATIRRLSHIGAMILFALALAGIIMLVLSK